MGAAGIFIAADCAEDEFHLLTSQGAEIDIDGGDPASVELFPRSQRVIGPPYPILEFESDITFRVSTHASNLGLEMIPVLDRVSRVFPRDDAFQRIFGVDPENRLFIRSVLEVGVGYDQHVASV